MNKIQIGEMDTLKRKVHDVIFEADTKFGKIFDTALFIMIILSVIAIMLDSVESINIEYGPYLYFFEWLFTILFTIEYGLRIYSLDKPSKYVFSFYGIVDIVAILPTYLSLFFIGSQYLLVIRILRLVRIFRVFKLSRYLAQGGALKQALIASIPKIIVFLISVFTLIVIIGTLMFLIEGPENGFLNIPTSVYWAVVTLTTVGYGDIVPHTILGKFVSTFIMVLGYGLIAVPTGIISVHLARTKEKDPVSTQACNSCGREGHDVDAKYCKFCGKKLLK